MVADQTIRDADANAQGSTTLWPISWLVCPLLLGTYTPKIDARAVWRFRPNPLPAGAGLVCGMEARNGACTCCRSTNFDVSPRKFSVCRWETKPPAEYLRVFLSGAVDQQPDKQGRVLVPQMLRDYANLGSDVVVIGVGTVPNCGIRTRGSPTSPRRKRIFRYC